MSGMDRALWRVVATFALGGLALSLIGLAVGHGWWVGAIFAAIPIPALWWSIRKDRRIRAELRRLREQEARVLAMADEIERGEWGDHWRDINVHGAIRNYTGETS